MAAVAISPDEQPKKKRPPKMKQITVLGDTGLGEYGIFEEDIDINRSNTGESLYINGDQHTGKNLKSKSKYSDVKSSEVGGDLLDFNQQSENQSPLTLENLTQTVQTVTELWRVRQNWVQSRTALTLKIKGFCRRLCSVPFAKEEEIEEEVENESGEPRKFRKPPKNPDADALYAAIHLMKTDHPMKDRALAATLPLLRSREMIDRDIIQVEKRLEEAAKNLPGYKYCLETRGLSVATLYAIVGEAPGVNFHGLVDFRFHHNLWKRFGMSCSIIDGKRQMKRTGADALIEGYSPKRRSVMWNIGATVIKVGGELKEVYNECKVIEQEKARSRGLTILPANKIPKGQEENYISEGHIHNRAKRMMEKYILRTLRAVWIRELGMTHIPF